MNTDIKVYEIEEIIEMCKTWVNFNGFSGEKCYHCKKTCNILAGPHGYFCVCGSYNATSWNYSQPPHEKPDYGTPRINMTEAYKKFREQQEHDERKVS